MDNDVVRLEYAHGYTETVDFQFFATKIVTGPSTISSHRTSGDTRGSTIRFTADTQMDTPVVVVVVVVEGMRVDVVAGSGTQANVAAGNSFTRWIAKLTGHSVYWVFEVLLSTPAQLRPTYMPLMGIVTCQTN